MSPCRGPDCPDARFVLRITHNNQSKNTLKTHLDARTILRYNECPVDKKTKALFSEIMREIGRKGGKIGGKIGGKRSLETMTPEERSARAKKASTAAAKKRTAERLARERKASRD